MACPSELVLNYRGGDTGHVDLLQNADGLPAGPQSLCEDLCFSLFKLFSRVWCGLLSHSPDDGGPQSQCQLLRKEICRSRGSDQCF